MSDYAIFASADFDPNEYAHAVLAGESYPSQSVKPKASKPSSFEPAKEDISVAISKLNFAIDDVTKQLKTVVTTHHEELLTQAAGVNNLESSLGSVKRGLMELDSSLDKLRSKIRVPYQSLDSHVDRLQKLQQASDVLRRISRFVILARRLEVQMAELNKGGESDTDIIQSPQIIRIMSDSLEPENEKERAIAKAALTIAELMALYEESTDSIDTDESDASRSETSTKRIPLQAVNFITAHIPIIQDARTTVTNQMEALVLTGLETLDQSALASSLQTAHNLRILPELVQGLVFGLTEAVDERIRSSFDLSRISKEASPKDASSQSQGGLLYKSRVRTEPTNSSVAQWTLLLWSSLENLINEMTSCCVKVYTLEKVLKLKKDATSGVTFLDDAMKLLESMPTTAFWASLGRSLEKHSKDAAKSSPFVQTTLSTGYPRLLRLVHEFFAKVAVHTDTVYTQSYQSPETVLVLRSLSTIEASYLTRCSNRLNEAVAQVFAGGARSPPGVTEGVNVACTIANELDSAKFDPMLVQSVAKSVVASLEQLLSRWDSAAARDRAATLLAGPSATSQQILNGQLVTFLYSCWFRLDKLDDECSGDVLVILRPSIVNLQDQYERLVNPLLSSIRREFAAIIATLHKLDFSKTGSANSMMGSGGASIYMEELVAKLSFVKSEIMLNYAGIDIAHKWIISIVQYVIRTFVLHVSIAKPLGEAGKLQLTSDMTELEFALSAFMFDETHPKRRSGGDWTAVTEHYRALRAMRPLLFLDNSMLANSEQTAGLEPLIVLHHILVRSPIPLPHSLHGWAEAEYVRWVDEHSAEESLTLIESGLSHWEKMNESESNDPALGGEYIQLARVVLANAKQPRV